MPANEKASVLNLPCAPTHVESITIAVHLGGAERGGRSSRVLNQLEAEQLDCMKRNDGFGDIVKKDVGKQDGRSREQKARPICKWM